MNPPRLPLLAIVALALSQNFASAADSRIKLPPVKAQLEIKRDGLPNFFSRIKQGSEVKVAYFGGSITAANGWRVYTREWLSKRFPKSKFTEIDAAIGGTGSDLGVYRLDRDVLQHRPDLMFVEFSVNDGGAAPENIWKAMEGIVRQTWTRLPNCDICFVYTFRVGYEKDLSKGWCPQAAAADEVLAEHYGIPSINMALRTVQLHDEGKLIFKADPDSQQATDAQAKGQVIFSKDGVHPLEPGHRIYTEVIGGAVEAWSKTASPGLDHSTKLASPMVPDHWQKARMVAIDPAMLHGDWKKLSTTDGLGKSFGKRMDQIWEAGTPGQSLSFRFRGSAVKLYDLLGPDGGQAIVTIDGVTQAKPVPRFDSYCTYHRLATLKIADGLDPEKFHTVKIEVHPEQPDRKPVAFRLKDPDKELKEEKFQGTRLRIGNIQFLGDKIETL